MKRVVLACAVAIAGMALGGAAKEKKPHLEMRVAPRFSFAPVNAFFTLELQGGDDVEDFYCPELEWDWDDGGKSVHEADCPPFEPGTKIERRYTAEHEYKVSGYYDVKVTMRRGDRTLAVQAIKLTVRPGMGENRQP